MYEERKGRVLNVPGIQRQCRDTYRDENDVFIQEFFETETISGNGVEHKASLQSVFYENTPMVIQSRI